MNTFRNHALRLRNFACGCAISAVFLIVGCDQSPSGKSADKTPSAKPTENPRVAPREQPTAPHVKADEHEGHDHEHGHKAPHGGVLVSLGDHFANIELVQDTKEKTLTAYAYDSCAENLVRLKQEKIEVSVTTADGVVALSLEATDNPLTGEKPGDASAFHAKHDKLASPIKSGEISKINIRGSDFANVAFSR